MNLTGILLAGGRSSRFGFNKLDIRNCLIPLFIDQAIKLSFFCSDIIIVTSVSNYMIVAAELEKIESYFSFFYKYTRRYFEMLQVSGRKCVFPDKIPKIKLLLDGDFIIYGQKNSNLLVPGLQNAEDSGPIMGIYTGLKNAPDYYSLVLASDMPFISYRLLNLITVFLKRNFKSIGKSNAKMPLNLNSDKKPGFVQPDFAAAKKCRDIYVIKRSKGFEVLCGIYSKYCISIMTENIIAKKNKISDIFTEIDTEILDEHILEANSIDDNNFFNINRPQDYDDFINIWNLKAPRPSSIAAFPGSREEISFASIWAEFFLR